MLRKVKVQPNMPDEPMKRSRFVRLIPNVLLRSSSSEKVCAVNDEIQLDGSCEFEPSSVCLAKMVQNFMEGNSANNINVEKGCRVPVKCGRSRCNCFNGDDDGDDSSGDEPDCFAGCFGDSNHGSSAFDASDILKSLVPCASIVERNLLADTAKIVEKNKMFKERAQEFKNVVTNGLVALGYAASICKSRWEKTAAFPAGEYEYIDVVHVGERLLIDIDFRSEFEIARPTKGYKTLLQTLPVIFVGKPARLEKIISTMTDAAKQSLKKKGLHFPPWRKAEYVKLKWLAPYTRTAPTPELPASTAPISITYTPTTKSTQNESDPLTANEEQEQELVFPFPDIDDHQAMAPTHMSSNTTQVVGKEWNLKPLKPAIKTKTGFKVVTGLSSIMKD